ARENLEHETPGLLTIASSLDLVERYMVWLYPHHVAKARISGILPRLDSLPTSQRESLVKRLTALSEAEKENYGGELRSVLDDTIGAINAQVIEDRITTGLQVNRLRALRLWGLIILLIFFAFSPLATNLANIQDWPSQFITSRLVELPFS